MATETEWSCTICCDAQDGVASVLPCLHQFCVGCILRWARTSLTCPLCRGQIGEVRFSVWRHDDYLWCVIMSPEESPQDSNQAGRAPPGLANSSSHRPAASPPPPSQGTPLWEEHGAARPEGRATVGGLLPEIWAELFQRNRHLLDPMLPCLRWELEALFQEQWCLAAGAESQILQALCFCGLEEEAMVQQIQAGLQEHAAPLLHGLIDVIVQQCSEEAQRMLRTLAAGEEEDNGHAASPSPNSPSPNSPSPTSSSPTSSSSSPEETPAPQLASSSSPPAASGVEEHPSIPQAALRRAPGCPPPAPIPAEQEQSQEEPGEATVAGPSAQGGSRSPSAPSRNHLPGGPRHPQKRKDPSPPDSPQTCKRPHYQRH
ncbi:TOPRS ligase, partial [Chroicocephalus maculipennis]|nr:TOPRS ligase [Chroicocephalus maculipennis]